jgi:hypothetical protein
MAITFLLDKDREKSLSTRWITAYLKNSDVPNEVRFAGVEIDNGTPLSSINRQTAWDNGTVVPNGEDRWDELELQDSEDLGRAMAIALAKVVRASGTLGDMVNAVEAKLAPEPVAKYNIAYQRIQAAWQAGTAIQQRKLIAIIVLMLTNDIGKRPK